jgi:GDP/UDP-N,N'-diacetylbacillosamine 2-epimerase (hydrolysing)
VAAKPYRHRVVQLGESPERVFLVGGLGADAINRVSLLDKTALEQSLEFSLGKRSLLITFHPPTLDDHPAEDQLQALLNALDALGSETQLLFTMPNADTSGRSLMAMVEAYVAKRPWTRAYASLGQLRYLSCMQFVDGVVGNSSSGLAEAPSFHIGTLNIGDRQSGRLKAASIIDCAPVKEDILAGLRHLSSPAFKATLATVTNPYGAGGASNHIVQILRDYPLDNLCRKKFFDIPFAVPATESTNAVKEPVLDR